MCRVLAAADPAITAAFSTTATAATAARHRPTPATNSRAAQTFRATLHASKSAAERRRHDTREHGQSLHETAVEFRVSNVY